MDKSSISFKINEVSTISTSQLRNVSLANKVNLSSSSFIFNDVVHQIGTVKFQIHNPSSITSINVNSIDDNWNNFSFNAIDIGDKLEHIDEKVDIHGEVLQIKKLNKCFAITIGDMTGCGSWISYNGPAVSVGDVIYVASTTVQENSIDTGIYINFVGGFVIPPEISDMFFSDQINVIKQFPDNVIRSFSNFNKDDYMQISIRKLKQKIREVAKHKKEIDSAYDKVFFIGKPSGMLNPQNYTYIASVDDPKKKALTTEQQESLPQNKQCEQIRFELEFEDGERDISLNIFSSRIGELFNESIPIFGTNR